MDGNKLRELKTLCTELPENAVKAAQKWASRAILAQADALEALCDELEDAAHPARSSALLRARAQSRSELLRIEMQRNETQTLRTLRAETSAGSWPELDELDKQLPADGEASGGMNRLANYESQRRFMRASVRDFEAEAAPAAAPAEEEPPSITRSSSSSTSSGWGPGGWKVTSPLKLGLPVAPTLASFTHSRRKQSAARRRDSGADSGSAGASSRASSSQKGSPPGPTASDLGV